MVAPRERPQRDRWQTQRPDNEASRTLLLPLTVAIPVRNAEANRARCLQRLTRFADIVVIDSGSTAATRQIAHRFGPRIVDVQWDGCTAKKRNGFLLDEAPRQPWVLFLDADAIVDDFFCDALADVLPGTDARGFWRADRNVFRDRDLSHGLPPRKLALFRVEKALDERIEEDGWSGLDMEIHEHPVVDGTVGEIAVPVEHREGPGAFP